MLKDSVASKKNKILMAAEQVFAKHGYEKATLDEIMALADVGKGTIYKYFSNKEQLFYNLVVSKNIPFVENLQQAVTAQTTLKAKMVAFFEVMIDFYRENAALWQIICFEMTGEKNGCIITTEQGVPKVISKYALKPSEAEQEQMIRYYLVLAEEFTILKELIASGVASGELKEQDAEVSTMFLFFGVAMCIFHPHPAVESLDDISSATLAVDRFFYGNKM